MGVVYGDTRPSEASEKLQKWLQLLPDNIMSQIHAALRQERPFLPPDITPEMMAAKNSSVPSMTQMDILYVSYSTTSLLIWLFQHSIIVNEN